MICGELGVPWEGDGVLTLRHSTSDLPRRRSGIAFWHLAGHLAIEHLGGIVPVVAEPTGVARKAQEWRQKVRTAYFA